MCCSVNVSVLCVACLVEQFAMCLGVVAILLLNVMDVFSVCGSALLDRPCMVFQRVCVCCACDPNERLSAPSICFVCVFVCRKLSPHLESWITGVGSPYAISLSDFACYVFGQEPAVPMHLALWYVLLVCHQYDVCENSVSSVYVGGYGGLSESGLCVFCKLCPVCFLVVGKGPSILL